MTLSDIGAKGTMRRALATCARCGAGVEFPSNYCDMCGGRITPGPAPDPRRGSEKPVERREYHPVPLGAAVSERRRDTPRADPEAASRSLTSAFRILYEIEKTVDSTETPTSDGNLARRVFNRIASGRKVRTEMAKLHRTLDLARKEASKAASLDPDSIVETDDGPLNAQALLSLADRAGGKIDLLAGRPREAVRHFQSSIQQLETRDACFDLAVAYERIGEPGEALCAYERCSAIAPESQLGIDALDEAERLRSKMIMGGWFVGSWKIIVAFAYFGALSLLSLVMIPYAGIAAFVGCGGGLGVYLWANFRRPVISEDRERRSSGISSSVRNGELTGKTGVEKGP